MLDIDRRYLLAGLIVIMLITFIGGMKYGDFKQADPEEEKILSTNIS